MDMLLLFTLICVIGCLIGKGGLYLLDLSHYMKKKGDTWKKKVQNGELQQGKDGKYVLDMIDGRAIRNFIFLAGGLLITYMVSFFFLIICGIFWFLRYWPQSIYAVLVIGCWIIINSLFNKKSKAKS